MHACRQWQSGFEDRGIWDKSHNIIIASSTNAIIKKKNLAKS